MMQTTSLIFICVTSVLCLPGLVSAPNSRFRAITDCSCPQDVTAYECIVCGRATVWEGTALDSCSGREITLTSQDFVEPLQPIYCNGGTVAAHGISAENGCFTSQLDIVFDGGFQGRRVRCLVDNGTHASEIGSDVLTLSIDPYPPPEGVRLARATTSGLIFKWNQTQNNCPSLSYNIVSENCGQCPNSTNGTLVNCSNFSISSSVTLCHFAVQSVICGNSGAPVIGNLTSSIIVNITVPTVNQVKTIPRYHIKHGLTGLTVTFPKVDPFIIYDGINDTATSYVIYYSDSDTGKLCGSSKLSPLSCDTGICSEEFYDIVEFSMCRASANINVTVSVITTLGEGPLSNPIKEEHQNNFVDVHLIHLESVSINCTFLTVAKGTPISCIATTDSVTDTKPCPHQRSISGTRENDNDLTIIISLDNFLEETDSSKYCGIKVNATADARTVIVNGNFLAISNPGPNGSAINTAAVVLLPMVTVITMMIIKFV